MAPSNGNGGSTPDARCTSDRLGREGGWLQRPEEAVRLENEERFPHLGIREEDDGFVLVAHLVAKPVEELQLEIEWDEVVLTLPVVGDPRVDCRRTQRVRLPAAVDPNRVEMVFAEGVLLLHLPRRTPRAVAATPP